MPVTFDQSKDDIARLVKHFAINREAYRGPNYKEAHARQEFIDPLFTALGWDVANSQHAAPDYREVVFEDTVEIEGQKKAPDYVFRVGRERKFFVEAKKPGVDLKAAAAPAYQLRRYAWTAKLPLSVLTDFEELATYDCRSRPAATDKPSVGRVSYFNYAEYADRWREIWDVYSREAVWGGSFDQFAQASKGKRGTSAVDTEFLKEIEGWRDALARNLALRNPDLGIDALNDAVQRTIDRIIFLRLTEDRGIEDYGRLRRLAEGDEIYKGLVKLFRAADTKYNSGLFDFSREGDRLTAGLSLDDKTLRPILADLYFPQSPYEFSVLPPEILGNVYEQFLGKVIRLTAGHQAKVEEKPEVKKAGGVYYTPAYIVKYIVENTVGKQVAGKNPLQLHGFRVLDPACGSGSFLLGAYQYLLDYYQGWYAANAPEKNPRAVRGDGASWKLTTAEKKRILTEHIFGVDIDRQAVEVTKLSLLLAVLDSGAGDDASKQLSLLPEQAKERVLPNLDRNIKCGNSLIGPDYFAGQLLPDDAEMKQVNPFDWKTEFPEAMKAGGFDCVIGNPPYVLIQGEFRDDRQLEYFRSNFVAASYKIDTYHLFVERSIRLAKKGGLNSMITPANYLTNNGLARLRQLLLVDSQIMQVVVIEDGVFQGISVDNAIFVIKVGEPTLQNFSITRAAADGQKLWPSSEIAIAIDRISKDPLMLFTGTSERKQSNLTERILFNSQPLGEIAHVNFGKQLRDRKKYLGDVIEIASPTKTKPPYKPCYTGRDVMRYQLRWNGLACFDDRTAQSGGCWDDDKQNAKDKLVTRQIGRYPEFSIDRMGFQCLNTMFMVKVHIPNLSPLYVLGILNSRLTKVIWLDRFYDQRKTFPKIKGTYLDWADGNPIGGCAIGQAALNLKTSPSNLRFARPASRAAGA